MEKFGLGFPADQSAGDFPEADDIKVGEIGAVVRAAGNGVELAQMTFGFPSP